MFHRLVTPSYIGGLPSGYDILNTGGALIDPILTVGPTQPTYFVGFGEDGRSAAVNRGLKALADNTDAIDDFLHANFAVITSSDFAASSGASVVGTALIPVFVGVPGTSNTQAGLEPYFHVTDQNNNDIVDLATNNQIVVTGVSPGGAVGSFYVGTVSLTLNITPSVPYRVWYGVRSSLIEMARDNFIRTNVWSAQHKQAGLLQFINDIKSVSAGKGAELVGLNTTGFSGTALTIAGGGGLSTTSTNVKQSLQSANDELIRRRCYSAVITDGSISVGGDYNGASLDTALTAFNSATTGQGARFHLRPADGSIGYTIGNGAPTTFNSELLYMDAEARFSAISLVAGRTNDFILTKDVDLCNISIFSLATNLSRFKYNPLSPIFSMRVRSSSITGASLSVDGTTLGGRIIIEDSTVASGPGATAPVAGLEITGTIRVDIKRSLILNAGNGTPSRNVYIHDVNSSPYSSITVSDSYFSIGTAGVNAIDLSAVNCPVTFRNCLFEVTATSGAGYAVLIQGTAGSYTFENCTFTSANGQVFKSADGAKVNLINCTFTSLSTVSGATTNQMVYIVSAGGSLVNCDISIGTSSLRGGSATSTNPVVDLSGNTEGGINVDGLTIAYDNVTTDVHNFSTVILNSGNFSHSPDVYKNVTLDMNSRSPSGGGTLGGRISSDPAFLEVNGQFNRAQCVVENLRIINVNSPGTTSSYRPLYAKLAQLKAVSIDAVTSPAAGSFTRPTQFEQCDVENLIIGRIGTLKHTLLQAVAISDNTRVVGGDIWFRTSTYPGSFWVFVGKHCTVDDVRFYWLSTVGASTTVGVGGSLEAFSMNNCELWADVDWDGGTKLVSFTGNAGQFNNNRLLWGRAGASQILASTGAGCMFTNNQFIDTAASTPTFSVTGTGSVSANNTTALIAGMANPS